MFKLKWWFNKPKPEPKSEPEEFLDFPQNEQISPFEPIDAGNYFAATYRKLSYLCSFEELCNRKIPAGAIHNPLDYCIVLAILKRHSIVENGNLIYQNQFFDDGYKVGDYNKEIKSAGFEEIESVQYIVYICKTESWCNSSFKSYYIQSGLGESTNRLGDKIFDTPERAIRYAINVSSRSSVKCIIAQYFSLTDSR